MDLDAWRVSRDGSGEIFSNGDSRAGSCSGVARGSNNRGGIVGASSTCSRQLMSDELGAKNRRLWVVTELYYPEETSTGYYLTRIAEGLAEDRDVKVLCGQP